LAELSHGEIFINRKGVMPMTNSPSANSLDLRNAIETPLRQFAPWLVMVLLITWAGYPGVVCVTPMAWLIALRAGILCVLRSRSEQSSKRLTEAAIAGAVLGLLQGILFAIIISRLQPISASDQAKSNVLTLIMIVVGIFAGASLSFFTAYLREQHRSKGQ
jgi:NhaP-type Na+/H+ or K+/H+ antiporter